ncbi:MAG: hypothetical protein ACLVL6_06060 [Clostridium paraputrificum]|uniref:hypothetical protein n=1 Tax=Clostridium paraputrificum TaxID=29363 RepID=UPI000EA2ED2D|nr:hypothetical protein [Clostridium paraputrificum]RKI48037.1 hypothetical protein D7V67_08920 [Clostridium paraputrificum]
MINFQYYPKSNMITNNLRNIINVFEQNYDKISSVNNKTNKSNEVLSICKEGLKEIGYRVESKEDGVIQVPVLFGRNNTLEKSFRADAYNEDEKTVIEVEAGRGVMNNQFLKDLFQACMMQDVDYLVIAVRNEYKTKSGNEVVKVRTNYDFEEVCKFFDALYSTERLKLPLKGILIIGY